MKDHKKDHSNDSVIWFDKPIKGFIGAKKEEITLVGGEKKTIWVKIAPLKKARGFIPAKMKTRG